MNLFPEVTPDKPEADAVIEEDKKQDEEVITDPAWDFDNNGWRFQNKEK